MGRVIAFAYGIGCYGVFFATFLYLIGFVGGVLVPKGIDDGPASDPVSSIAINLALIALFGLQHSVMARPAFKAWLTRALPQSIERSTFVLAASLALILLYWLWQPMPQVVWEVTDPVGAGLLWGLFALGFALVLAATFVIDHFDLFGLRQVWLGLVQRTYRHPPFRITYFYRFIRHPIYLGLLIAFWSAPAMTVGRLLFAAGMTIYIFIGIHYEERDLTAFIGKDYERYRQRVPMLVPSAGKVHETVRPAPDAG